MKKRQQLPWAAIVGALVGALISFRAGVSSGIEPRVMGLFLLIPAIIFIVTIVVVRRGRK